MVDREPANVSRVQMDQTGTTAFRAFLLVQVVVAALFGLGTFLAPGPFATLTGYTGNEPFFYRLLGAATFGYAVVAWLAYQEHALWHQVRIPMVATFTFNAAAVLASVLSLLDGDSRPLVLFVLVAASVFALLTAYWLLRNQGTPLGEDRRIGSTFKVVMLFATAAAAFFGIAPLLLARPFASILGLSTDDMFILRGAAAATLGYALAGILELRATQWSTIRLQVIGAIVFNAVSWVGAALYLLGGGRSVIGWLLLVATALFTLGLTWGLAQARARGAST